MSELVLAMLGCPVTAIALTFVLLRFRPAWSRLRTTLVGAAILPGIVIAACALVFFDAATAPPESCGVDACGMAMMAAMAVSSVALIGFLIGWISAFAAQALWARR